MDEQNKILIKGFTEGVSYKEFMDLMEGIQFTGEFKLRGLSISVPMGKDREASTTLKVKNVIIADKSLPVFINIFRRHELIFSNVSHAENFAVKTIDNEFVIIKLNKE